MTLSPRDLDAILALQLTVAWAGEAQSQPPRLGWWRTDLADENGGAGLLLDLLPRTWRWASLQAVRLAAIRVDRRARRQMAESDDVRTLFHWGFQVDEKLEGLNLVASNLKLGSLDHDDPALVELRRAVREETRLPEELTDRIVEALAGADYLGSLLQVGKEVRGAIEEFVEKRREELERSRQTKLFEDDVAVEEIVVDVETLMEALLGRLEMFLAEHTGGDDLGLRLHGEQLAAGMRFVRLLREDSYDLVVANPPYQGTSRMVDAAYVKEHYPCGKADLYAAFLERGLQLAKVVACPRC